MSIHGVMPINLHEDEDSKTLESLKNILFGNIVEEIIPASSYNKLGSVKGVLVGGNLSILQSLSGSPFQIKTRGKILFIEEIGEELYRIDRMMQSLKHTGFFKDIIGLAVGSFSDLKVNDTPYGKTYQEIILETVEEYDYPILFDVPAGHIDDNRALLLGGETTINVGEFVSCIRFIQ
jgi:muramoyltetrapeptide carboxypeptidase